MRARAIESDVNGIDNVLGLILAIGSLVYLTYAMLRPEQF